MVGVNWIGGEEQKYYISFVSLIRHLHFIQGLRKDSTNGELLMYSFLQPALA